jgi:chaperonin GroEL (HSP60 family)
MLYAGEYGDLLGLDKLCRFYHNTRIPILLIASSFSSQVYQMLAYLVSNNICKVYPVRMGIDGDNMLEVMHDIAYITGAEVIYPYGTWDLARCLGKCDGVLIKDGFCSIVPEGDMRQKAELRAVALRQMAEKEVNIERKIFLKERAAKLMSQVAVVSVGGKHRLNREYQRDKFIRAFSYVQNTMKNNRVINLNAAFKALKDMTKMSYVLDVMRDMISDKKYKSVISTYYPTNSLVSLFDVLSRIMRAISSVIVA